MIKIKLKTKAVIFLLILTFANISCGKKKGTGKKQSIENSNQNDDILTYKEDNDLNDHLPEAYYSTWKAVANYDIEDGKLKITPNAFSFFLLYKKNENETLEFRYEGEGKEYRATRSDFQTKVVLFDPKQSIVYTKSLFEIKAKPKMRFSPRKEFIRNDTLFVAYLNESKGSTAYIIYNKK